MRKKKRREGKWRRGRGKGDRTGREYGGRRVKEREEGVKVEKEEGEEGIGEGKG